MIAHQDKEAAERAADKGTEELGKETAQNVTGLGSEAAKEEQEKVPIVELVGGVQHPVIPVQQPVIPIHPAPRHPNQSRKHLGWFTSSS